MSPRSSARAHTALFGRTRPYRPDADQTANQTICSAATNNQTGEGVAIKKVTNVFSKKILAKRALREIKLLQHFRGKSIYHPVGCDHMLTLRRAQERKAAYTRGDSYSHSILIASHRSPVFTTWTYPAQTTSTNATCTRVRHAPVLLHEYTADTPQS